MAGHARPRRAGSAAPGPAGLRVLSVLLGVFFVASGVARAAWLTDSSHVLLGLERLVPNAAPAVRWYLQTICIPGAPLFARLVPATECLAGLALIAGFWTRMAAIAACLVVLGVGFAESALWSPAFLTEGAGLPVLGGLLALGISGARLPFSVSA